ERAKLMTVCDMVEENMTYYHNEYRSDMDKDSNIMLQKMDIDIVCICTPTRLHAKIALQAANAKKHIVLENPIAMNLGDTDKIIAVCRENKVKLSIVHPNRY